MAFLSIFCTNTINIFAGINGIEVGQSIVIALCIVINDILYVAKPGHPATDAHLFSLYFLLPFIGVSLALLYHNWYVRTHSELISGIRVKFSLEIRIRISPV